MLIDNCDNNKSIWRHDAFDIILIAAELRYVNETYVGACEIINHILRRRDICNHKNNKIGNLFTSVYYLLLSSIIHIIFFLGSSD